MIVYLITNKVNGKKYVGQTTRSLEQRIKGHRWLSSAEGGKNMPIATAIQKYGWDNFTAEILCECSTQDELNEKEVHYANKLNAFSPSGYNLKAGGAYGKMANELKRKIAKSNTGKKRTVEQRKRISEAHKGIPTSEELRRKRSENRKGKKLPDSAYKNIPVKTYELINPDGDKTTIVNLRAFCKEQNLDYISMHDLTTGRKKMYKGWTTPIPVEAKPVARPRRGKTYEFIDPCGNKVKTDTLPEYCRQNSLSYTTMLDLIAGRIPIHKGHRAIVQGL